MKTKLSYLLLLLLISFLISKTSEAQSARPNVILIVCDDMRWDSFEPNGGPSWFQTPSINRIAYEGVNFKNAFCTYSLCTPSRSSIVSGLYAHSHGAVDNFSHMNPNVTTVQTLLHNNGYHTGMIGKYGESVHQTPSWDYWFSVTQGSNYTNPKMIYGNQTKNMVGNITQIISDSADHYVAVIDTPFFLFLGHQVPHKIIVPLPQDDGVYANDHMPVPDNFAKFTAAYPSFLYADRAYYKDTAAVINDYENYFEGLNGVEDNVATIFTELAQRGILDNTMIIFMTDNGSCYGEHQLGGKALNYDPAIRSPLFIRYPFWFPSNSVVSNEFALNIDIAPTITAATKINDANVGFQGVSLKKLYNGNAHRNQFIAEYIRIDHPGDGDTSTTPSLRTLRTFDYMYTRYKCPTQTEELFNLQTDPEENHNLFFDTTYSAELNTMRSQLDSMLIVVKDTLSADTVVIDCYLVRGKKNVPFIHGSGIGFHFRLSPDPTTDFLQVDMENNSMDDAHLSITNTLGQLMKEEKWGSDINTASEKISVSDLPAGIYFISMTCGSETTQRTFVKN